MDWVKEEDKLMDTKNSDHLCLGTKLAETKEGSIRAVTIHHEDGEVTEGIVHARGVDKPPDDAPVFERCSGAPDEAEVYHVAGCRDGRRGPTMVNSPAFCDGWERIQWASRARREGGPT